MATIDRGWMRCATKTMNPSHGSLYKVQATVWKDKKNVGWLHSLKLDLRLERHVGVSNVIVLLFFLMHRW
jgi:hypothetical protein